MHRSASSWVDPKPIMQKDVFKTLSSRRKELVDPVGGQYNASRADWRGRNVPVAKLRAVIDCDPGVDDTMALFFGLLCPDVDVVAITTVWGNTRVEATTENALRLLEIVGR